MKKEILLTTAQLEQAIKSGDPDMIGKAAVVIEQMLSDANKKSFYTFVKTLWGIVSPSPLKDGWYLQAICDHLQHIRDIKRLIISVPPRHGKSTLTAVLFPAWIWASNPKVKIIASSYSLKDLSLRDSRACRDVIESPIYKQWFWWVKIREDQNTTQRFTNKQQGFRFATSVDSGNTGEGCDILIADDINNINTVHSDASRNSVLNWWTQVMSTRMNPGGWNAKVVCAQRCHEEDITGYVLAQEDADLWTHLVLPWEFDPDRRATTSLPWQDPRTEPGQVLSDLYSEEEIAEKKGGNGLGPTGFATQFNQLPSPKEGNVFQRHWFARYDSTPTSYLCEQQEIRKEWCRVVLITDLAISLKASADFTVCQAWAITPHQHLLLLEEFRGKVEGPHAIKEFQRMHTKYQPDAVYVEDIAFQRLMLQMLKQAGLPVKSLMTQGQDKKARCQRSLCKAECGQIWIPQGKAEWVSDWLDEICHFPNARHDDRLDCLAWAGIVAQKYPLTPLPSLHEIDKETKLLQADARAMGR